MKTPSRSLLLVVALGTLLAPGFAATPDRFERTRAHIDALLARHRKIEPLPAKPANPFFFAAAAPAPVEAAPAKPAEVTPATHALSGDEAILAYCVSRLRISGQVQRGGIAHLLINSATYRLGDLIPVRGTGDIVYYVRVSRLEPNEVEFGYNDVVLTVSLKG